MRSLKLATFAVFGMAVIVSLAQAENPVSSRASNIGPADTRSAIAPALPTPPVGDSSGPQTYLRAAHDALVAGRTGEAQQSLEMAETRQLSRTVDPRQAGLPDPDPAVNQIRDALHSLGSGDRVRALRIIDAMAQ